MPIKPDRHWIKVRGSSTSKQKSQRSKPSAAGSQPKCSNCDSKYIGPPSRKKK